MDHDAVNESLVRNAFDFLERAIDDFPDFPKYSVIHFYAAVELILKSRLMQEHWALVVSKPDEADQGKFLAGVSHSVGLREANKRLKKIAQDGLSVSAFNAFDTLSKHRNRLMHFFHPEIVETPEQLAAIVTEQSRAWFHLHDLLSKQWSSHFVAWEGDVQRLHRLMMRHREYLNVRYESMVDHVKQLKNDGARFKSCVACGFESAVVTHLLGRISEEKCLVCDHGQYVLSFDCPSCGHKVEAAYDGCRSCGNCDETFSSEDIYEILDGGAGHAAYLDGDFTVINCGFCDGYHSVIPYEGQYVCASCLEITSQYETCEWCHEGNTGDMENSLWGGCNFCDGRSGWMKDD